MNNGISNTDYHAMTAISKSGLDLLNVSPAHYKYCRDHPRPPTLAMRLGSAFHCLVLESDIFSQNYVITPADAPNRPSQRQIDAKKQSDATIKAIGFWERWNSENNGKAVVTGHKDGDDPLWKPGDWDMIHRMRDAVFEHSTARVLLNASCGNAEQSVFWVDKETGMECKCRPDFLNVTHNIVVDLKSTVDASADGFAASCGKYGYHRQDAFYSAGLRSTDWPGDEFVFVAVEKTPPYNIGVYTLNDEASYTGWMQCERLLRVYAECMATGKWCGYQEGVTSIQMPPWVLDKK